jgi:hypothetical protein
MLMPRDGLGRRSPAPHAGDQRRNRDRAAAAEHHLEAPLSEAILNRGGGLVGDEHPRTDRICANRPGLSLRPGHAGPAAANTVEQESLPGQGDQGGVEALLDAEPHHDAVGTGTLQIGTERAVDRVHNHEALLRLRKLLDAGRVLLGAQSHAREVLEERHENRLLRSGIRVGEGGLHRSRFSLLGPIRHPPLEGAGDHRRVPDRGQQQLDEWSGGDFRTHEPRTITAGGRLGKPLRLATGKQGRPRMS